MALFNIYSVANPPEKAEKPQKKKKEIKTMNVALVVTLLFAVMFTAVMIWLFVQCGSTPDTLITCVFAVLGGECGILGWIKTSKCKHEHESKKEEKDDEEAKG